jgi:hypothetical protein
VYKANRFVLLPSICEFDFWRYFMQWRSKVKASFLGKLHRHERRYGL